MTRATVDNPRITECIEIKPGLHRVRTGTGAWAEIYADEDHIKELCALPLDAVLPWGECEVCGCRFLDWDDGGMCGPCEYERGDDDFDIYDVPGVPHSHRRLGTVAELDADSAGYGAL
jgi:hypothetical protein